MIKLNIKLTDVMVAICYLCSLVGMLDASIRHSDGLEFQGAQKYLKSFENLRKNFDQFENWLNEKSLASSKPDDVLERVKEQIKLPEFADNSRGESIKNALRELSLFSETTVCKKETIELLAHFKRGIRWFGRGKSLDIITASLAGLDLNYCKLFLLKQFDNLKPKIDGITQLNFLLDFLNLNEEANKQQFENYLAKGGILPVAGVGLQLGDKDIMQLVKKLAKSDSKNDYVTVKKRKLFGSKKLTYNFDNFFYTFDEYLIKPCARLNEIQGDLMDAIIALELIRSKAKSSGPFGGGNFANYPKEIKFALYKHLKCDSLFHKANKDTLKNVVETTLPIKF